MRALGYSGVPGIAWYAPLLEPLFFSLLLWRKGGERERKEECSACVCDARAHTLAHTHTHSLTHTQGPQTHKTRTRKGSSRTGNDGVRKERASAHPLSRARGYTHTYTAHAAAMP